MKTKRIELDVDFIGGGPPLTKEETQLISDFIKAQKQKRAKKPLRKTKPASRKKVA